MGSIYEGFLKRTGRKVKQVIQKESRNRVDDFLEERKEYSKAFKEEKKKRIRGRARAAARRKVMSPFDVKMRQQPGRKRRGKQSIWDW